MATGSTPLLGLALPVTGELPGTWGDEVNNKLTSLVDSAIAGTTTLTDNGSSTYTLTSSALTANQARQAIILWNTNDNTKTATRTIIAPASSKVYVVINKSTYQDIKLCAPGPTTGVTIFKSERCHIAWDASASDFVKIATNISAVTDSVITSGTGRTLLGFEAGKSITTGAGNTLLGYKAAIAVTTGYDWVAIGRDVASNWTTGGNNILIGTFAGTNITEGNQSVIIGVSAKGMYASPTTAGGSYCTVIGTRAGAESTEDATVLVGYEAGYNLTAAFGGSVCVGYAAGKGTGPANNQSLTAVGSSAAYSCNGAQYTTAIGAESLYAITTGDNNTALGYRSGRALTTGASNTIIGHNAAFSGTNNLTTGSNNTVIGNAAAASSASISNEITLGNSSIATLRCQVTTITALSDARDKTDIKALDAGLEFVNQLRPVRFTWNMRDGGKVGEADTGFIAQELKAVQEQTNTSIPGLVYESNPDRLEAGYGKLLPVLVKAIQELSAEVASLKAQLEAKNV